MLNSQITGTEDTKHEMMLVQQGTVPPATTRTNTTLVFCLTNRVSVRDMDDSDGTSVAQG